MSDPIVIVGAARSPMGSFLGDLKNATAADLGASATSASVARAGVDPSDVVTHLAAMARHRMTSGMASLCIEGGEATAIIALERVQ